MERWTEEQVAVVQFDYPRLGAKQTAARVGKSETSVRVKACRIGAKRVFHENHRGKRKLTPERVDDMGKHKPTGRMMSE